MRAATRFCEDCFLSRSSMGTLRDVRTQLADQLRELGIDPSQVRDELSLEK